MKKLIVNYYNNKPIGVVDLKEMSISQLQEFKATCEKNYKEYCEEQEKLEQEKNARILELERKVQELTEKLDQDEKVLKELLGEE